MSERLATVEYVFQCIWRHIRAAMPNRVSRKWGLVVRGNRDHVQPIRGGFQFVGGRTWTISFLRIVPEDTVRSYYFYDRTEDVDATS